MHSCQTSLLRSCQTSHWCISMDNLRQTFSDRHSLFDEPLARRFLALKEGDAIQGTDLRHVRLETRTEVQEHRTSCHSKENARSWRRQTQDWKKVRRTKADEHENKVVPLCKIQTNQLVTDAS